MTPENEICAFLSSVDAKFDAVAKYLTLEAKERENSIRTKSDEITTKSLPQLILFMDAVKYGQEVPNDPTKPKSTVMANAEEKLMHKLSQMFDENGKLREGVVLPPSGIIMAMDMDIE